MTDSVVATNIIVGPQCIAVRAAHRLLQSTNSLSLPPLNSDPSLSPNCVKVILSTAPQSSVLLTDSSSSLFLLNAFSPSSPVHTALLTSFIELSSSLPPSEFISHLNSSLILNTFLLPNHPTLSSADLSAWRRLKLDPSALTEYHAKIQSNPLQYRFIARWFNHLESVDELKSACNLGLSQVGSQWDDVMRLVKSQGSFELNLPGLELGKVVTRFPPEPSGYLHVGHAKAAMLNDFFARYFRGKLVLRFDDTNPMKEKLEFEKNILEDLKKLGIEPDVVEYTSDYFEQLMEIATQMVLEGKAYVDLTPVEELRDERMKMVENKYRVQSVEENLKMWKRMQQYKAGDSEEVGVLRAKIDMKSKNGAMRDPIMYRVVASPPHHRTGTTYAIYPSYDFSCPVVDSLEGVTHALRSAEYADREAQYYWMCDAVGMRRPYMWDFARLNFQYTVMSKRKLLWFVESGLVDGWDDPRFPTVQGIRRRGLTIEALRAFISSQGSSKNCTLMEWDKIWTVNKRLIDPIAPRFTAIDATSKVNVVVVNASDTVETQSVLKHKKNASVGRKLMFKWKHVIVEREDADSVCVAEIVAFMDWGNMKVLEKYDEGTAMKVEYLKDDVDYKKTKKWTWSADLNGELVSTKLIKYMYGHLVRKAKIEDDDEIENIVNDESKREWSVLGDVNLKMVKKGDIIQLARRGYYICDAVDLRDDAVGVDSSKVLTLIEIPDGRGRK